MRPVDQFLLVSIGGQLVLSPEQTQHHLRQPTYFKHDVSNSFAKDERVIMNAIDNARL
jgi:hypothetical protein